MSQKQTRQGGRPVDLRNRVKMTATATHPSIKAGTHFTIHQEQTAKLIAQGWAVEGHVSLEAKTTAAKTAKSKEAENA